MSATLAEPSETHWSIAEDTQFTGLLFTLNETCNKRAAKEIAPLNTEAMPVGPLEDFQKRLMPPPVTEAIKEMVERIVTHLHNYRMQHLYDTGSIRAIDRALINSLTAKFSRLNLVVWKDLGGSLTALLEMVNREFDQLASEITGIMGAWCGEVSSATIQNQTEASHLKMSTQIMACIILVEGAREDMRVFMGQRLKSLATQDETLGLVRALTEHLTHLESAIMEIAMTPEMSDPAVAHRVNLTVVAGPPLTPNFHHGALEGIVGSIGLSADGTPNPPTTTREGVQRRQQASLVKAYADNEHRFQVGCLCPDYLKEFEVCLPEEAAHSFMAPLIPNLLDEMDRCRIQEPCLQHHIVMPLSEVNLHELWTEYITTGEEGKQELFKEVLDTLQSFVKKSDVTPMPQPNLGGGGDPPAPEALNKAPELNPAPPPPPASPRPILGGGDTNPTPGTSKYKPGPKSSKRVAKTLTPDEPASKAPGYSCIPSFGEGVHPPVVNRTRHPEEVESPLAKQPKVALDRFPGLVIDHEKEEMTTYVGLINKCSLAHHGDPSSKALEHADVIVEGGEGDGTYNIHRVEVHEEGAGGNDTFEMPPGLPREEDPNLPDPDLEGDDKEKEE